MQSAEYANTINICTQKITDLPYNEIKYHLFLMLNTLKNKQTEFTQQFLQKIEEFIDNLGKLMQAKLPTELEVQQTLEQVFLQYQQLTNLAKIDAIEAKITRFLINLGAVILAFILGIAGGLIGGISGFVRGLWNFTNPLASFAIGVVTGAFLGGAIGFRLPKKLFKEELFRQLKCCLDGIHECIETMQKTHSFAVYKEQVRQKLLSDYFYGDEASFQRFLQNNVSYKINTLRARFLSPSLEGYLGQHAFMTLTIDENTPPLTIEFSTAPTDLTRSISQCEKRIVSGEKIVDMLALHEQLQITHTCTTEYIVCKMKPGEIDCLSYINKILIGTSQNATTVKRFDGKENWLGKNLIGFFVQNLSPFRQDILLHEPLLEDRGLVTGGG
ncbi:hypothetical protein [Legionella hackeliae]|uniref:Uncharacterized protein n=1 Tax=Legionella hackeliae TaxID=449 RepID=A0A0A8URR2_LEGHA|nr:hypothetical protein [Legionella hackeliae]KTD08752.1 hypothetical protein Lhac_2975 [Legionella hackeliae]CEK10181.1 conserved protein of unknown function [Legionella hackeliae]STX46905.1 Uncharacterised protein [Legionella hackeliae]